MAAPANEMYTLRKQLRVKVEATEGSDPTPADSDAIAVEDISITPEVEMHPRNRHGVSASGWTQVAGKRAWRITCRVPFKGSGTKDTAPEWGVLLKACGMKETVSAGVSVAYTPLTVEATNQSVTIQVLEAGLSKVATGCRGNCRWVLTAGGISYMEFDMLGAYVAPTDVSLGTPTYHTTVPPALLSSSWSVHADADQYVGGTAEINLNNAYVLREDVNTASGYKSCRITNRGVTYSYTPEQELVASFDWWAKAVASTEAAITFNIGGTTGNQFAFSMPKAQFEAPPIGDRDGITVLEVSGFANRSAAAGEDELSITQT